MIPEQGNLKNWASQGTAQVSLTPELDAFKAKQKAMNPSLFATPSAGNTQGQTPYTADATTRLAQGGLLPVATPALDAYKSEQKIKNSVFFKVLSNGPGLQSDPNSFLKNAPTANVSNSSITPPSALASQLRLKTLPGLANSGNALYSGVGLIPSVGEVPRQSSSPLLIDGYLSNNPAGKATDSAPKVAADTDGTTGQRVLDGVQMALDLVGLIPGAGEVADGLNALISLARGNYVDAALSALSMVPFAGWAASAGKGARYTAKAIDAAGTAVKYSDELIDAGRYAAKYADEAADAVQHAEEAADGAKYFSNALTEAAGDTKLPTGDSQIKHIFRDAEGHLPDTIDNRNLLESVVNNKKYNLGTDKYGTQWYAWTRNDGTQVWVRSRKGTIINGGVNNTPLTFDPDTGLNVNPYR